MRSFLVILAHLSGILTGAASAATEAGWIGVDLFFVLSGFLITGILLDHKQSPSYFRAFYGRRVLRIFPLYWAYLLIVFLGVSRIYAAFSTHNPLEHDSFLIHLLYLQNFMPDGFPAYTGLGHLWSLAVEEQFYLIWPFLVRFLSANALRRVCISLLVICPLLRTALFFFGFQPFPIYRLTPCRLDTLAMGALISISVRSDGGGRLGRRLRVIGPVSAGFLALVFFLQHSASWTKGPALTIGLSFTALASGWVILLAANSAKNGWLASALPTSFGKYSYGIYVLHPLLLSFIYKAASSLGHGIGSQFLRVLLVFTMLAASYLIARVSWFAIESPALRFKRLYRY